MRIITLTPPKEGLKINELVPGNVYRDEDGDLVLAVNPDNFRTPDGKGVFAINLKDGDYFWPETARDAYFAAVEGAFVEGCKL